MAYYLELLPKDLINLLCCYLNVREIETLCFSPKINYLCKTDEVWKFKIELEFPYIPAQYRQSQLLTPRNKYIELKSIRSVDYGSDYFTRLEEYIRRASRVPDRKMAKELLEPYYGEMIKFQMEGAASRNDQQMIANLLNRVKLQSPFLDSVQIGYGEARKLDELLIAMNLFTSNPATSPARLFSNVLKGTVGSGDIEALHKYESDDSHARWTIVGELPRATMLQKWPMVNYLISNYLLDDRIDFETRKQAYTNYLYTLATLWENDRFIAGLNSYNYIFNAQYLSILDAIWESGNIPLLQYLIDRKIVTFTDFKVYSKYHMYVRTLAHNHLDMIAYLQQYVPLNTELISMISSQFSSNDRVKLLPNILEYLKNYS